jgi:carbon monoxide dehydrogenase subunit G
MLYKAYGSYKWRLRLRIQGSYIFKAPREKVWKALLDPKVLAQCIPGCQTLKEIAPDRYEAKMKVGVAGLKDNYKCKIAIKDKNPFSHYVLSGEGSGTPGFLRGDLAIDLEDKKGQTIVRYSTDAKVGGGLAGVGQTMIGGFAKMMADQFLKKIERFL